LRVCAALADSRIEGEGSERFGRSVPASAGARRGAAHVCHLCGGQRAPRPARRAGGAIFGRWMSESRPAGPGRAPVATSGRI